MSETTPADTADLAEAPASPLFNTLPLDAKLLRAVADQGYASMTPIQAKAIPIVLAGRDVMGAAQTGTGKTAAFSLPLLQKMLKHENASMSPARHPVRALVLAPTRELADLPAVFNYDVPFNAEDYVHRIGRTVRAGDEHLLALQFHTDSRSVFLFCGLPAGGAVASPSSRFRLSISCCNASNSPTLRARNERARRSFAAAPAGVST